MKIKDSSTGKVHTADGRFSILCESEVNVPEIIDDNSKTTCNKCLRLLEREKQRAKVK